MHEIRSDAAIQSVLADTAPTKAEFMGLHVKAIVVDRERVFIGSMNLDPRSSDLNSEMGVIIDSRELAPSEAVVVTVGSIHGGTKHNIIGNDCHLQITVRSYSDEVRQQLHDAIVRRAKGVAVGAGAPEPKIEFTEGTPAMFNDEKLAARLREVLRCFRRRHGQSAQGHA